MPSQNCDSWCQLAEPVAYACTGQMTSHPAEGFMATLRSLLMPAFASAMTAAQSTAARSVGSRATLARRRALYEWMSWTNCVCVMAMPLIHVSGHAVLVPGIWPFAHCENVTIEMLARADVPPVGLDPSPVHQRRA